MEDCRNAEKEKDRSQELYRQKDEQTEQIIISTRARILNAVKEAGEQEQERMRLQNESNEARSLCLAVDQELYELREEYEDYKKQKTTSRTEIF